MCQVSPKILPFNFGDEDYTEGMSAQLQCIVTEGDLPVDIRWVVAGKGGASDAGISVTKIGAKSSILNIDSVDASHAGSYTCTARNAAGKSSYSAQLTVVGTCCLISHQCFQVKFDDFSQFAPRPVQKSSRANRSSWQQLRRRYRRFLLARTRR